MKHAKPIVSQPSLLVCKEKHGDIYYYVSNDEDLFRAALTILTGRLREGRWYLEPGEEPPSQSSMMEDMAKLGNFSSVIREAAERELARRIYQLEAWTKAKQDWDEINEAVSQKDGRKAWRCLRARSDGEYEEIRLEQLQDY